MLRELAIRHLALVEEVRATFGPGLNVLTGETGAGKSIVIGALTLALGSRGGAELIRSGADEAVAEAAFELPDTSPVQRLLASQGIPLETGESLLLRRHLAREGRSRAYVNGTMTVVTTLRTLGEHLVDIHGQHESVLLQNPHRHLELLDAFGGLTEQVQSYHTCYRRLQVLEAERETLQQDEREKAQRKDLLEHQIREVDTVHLTEGEEEALQAERAILTHHEKLLLAVEETYARLEGDDGAILSALSGIGTRLREAGRIDPRLAPLEAMAEEGKTLLQEVALSLRDYRERVQFDPGRLETIEGRLHAISRLKKKYGATISEILKYREQAALKLKHLEGAEERVEALTEEIRVVEGQLWQQGERLSKGRGEAAKQLAREVVRELHELGMPRADFRVELKRSIAEDRRGLLKPAGLEEAEFLIAPNPGEGFKPLAKIASGGELSRIMLAMKNILASADQTPTLIFDEVDAGIGGRMAEVVGRKLWRVSRERQVICITHLPHIAAFADVHLRVEKGVRGGRTEARLKPLSREEGVEELGRMLGGPERSAIPFKHAQELLQAAMAWKRQQGKGEG
ncbi:MAG: DNA repair protein RecN [Candidatus Methylomirabilales bacterium]